MKDKLDSKRAVTNYDILAREYAGKVRFGWVNRNENELLAETFAVRQMPATYLIMNHTAYNYRDWTYAGNLRDYIEEGKYVNSSLSFTQPGRFLQVQLYLYSYPIKWFFV